MGITTKTLAAKYGITRQAQDYVALESHHKAEAAIQVGHFKEGTVPFEIPGKMGKKEIFEQDEHSCFGLQIEDFTRLYPVSQTGWHSHGGQFLRT